MWIKEVCRSWLASAHKNVGAIAKDVNGPMFCDVGGAVLANDTVAIEMFRKGLQLINHATHSLLLLCLC